jgi:defect-in-organelle-trafficking protein DotC
MRASSLAAVSLLALSVSGCVGFSTSTPTSAQGADEAALRADVNPGYKAGQVKIPTKPTASLGAVLNAVTATSEQAQKEQAPEDKLRIPAMQEAALSYGARAGLAWSTREINKVLEGNSPSLSRTYDFQRLMIKGPNDVMVSPPVISEARDTWESSDAGKTLRVADTVYEIIRQATFSPVAPMWQSYLISDFKEPEAPPQALSPRDNDEVERYRNWVREGWKKGEEQAKEIFDANMNRLNRDFTGMVRYRSLLEEGKVAPPVLAEGNLGVTGTGQDMRVNDRAIRITRDPSLVIKPNTWDASPTSTDNNGKQVGVDRSNGPEAEAAQKEGSAWGDGRSVRRHVTKSISAKPTAPKKAPAPKTIKTDDDAAEAPAPKASSGGKRF